MFKRAFRTFIQTALGYVITNVTLALGGLDFNDGDVVKNALIGLAVAAVAAGASAVMNLKREKIKTMSKNISQSVKPKRQHLCNGRYE